MSTNLLSVYKGSRDVLNPKKYTPLKVDPLLKEVNGSTRPPHTKLSPIAPPQKYTSYIASLKGKY
jgi:hypothetical protein